MKRKIEILILFGLGLLPLFWLGDSHAILGHDSGFRIDYHNYFKSIFWSWNYGANFGTDLSLFKGFLVIQAPEAFLYYLGFSINWIESLIFSFWFLAMLFSMYIFVNSFFPDKKFWIVRIYSSVLFAFNFYILQAWFIAERSKFSLYAAIPLGLTIIIKTLNGNISLRRGVLLFAVLSFFFNGGGLPPSYGGLLVAYFIAFIVMVIINLRKTGLSALLKSGVVLLSFGAVFILVNFYWVLPQIYLYLNSYSQSLLQGGGIEGIIAWENSVTKNASITNLLRLQGIPDWYDNPTHSYANHFISNPLLILLSFIPVLTIVLGLFSFKKIIKEKNFYIVIIALFIFLISLVLTSGSHQPFGTIYILLIKYIPGFTIFRSALYKFGPAFWFSVAFLSGYSINYIIEKFISSKKNIIRIGCILIVLIILYHFPFFSPNFFSWHKYYSTRVETPSYIYEMGDFINNNFDPEKRILVLPPNSNQFRADAYLWKYWSLDILPRLLIQNPILANDSHEIKIVDSIYENIRKKNYGIVHNLLESSGIRLLLFRDDLAELSESDAKSTMDFLQDYERVKKVKQFGKWSLYEIDLPDFQIVVTPKYLVKSSTSEQAIGMLTELFSATNSSFMINESSLDDNSVYAGEAIEFEFCRQCTKAGQKELQDSIKLPNHYFFPDSYFAFISDFQEKEILENTTDEQSKVDANLTIIGRRLSEVAWLSQENKDFYKSYSTKLQQMVDKNCQDLSVSLSMVEMPDRIFSANRTVGYLARYIEILNNLAKSEKDVATTTQNIKAILSSCEESVRKYGWIIEDDNTYPYYLSVESLENMQLRTDIKVQEYQLYINDKAVAEGDVTFDKHFNQLLVKSAKKSDTLPRVVVYTAKMEKSLSSPTTSIKKINPAKYTVTVSDVESDFVLKFSQQWSAGWKAYYSDLDKKQSQYEIRKVRIDGYANGWYVNRTGDYEITIEYRPYELFIYGAFVTVVSLLVILAINIIRIKNR